MSCMFHHDAEPAIDGEEFLQVIDELDDHGRRQILDRMLDLLESEGCCRPNRP